METVLLYVLGILVVIVGLLVSIGLHELGHLIPAKRFGVKVGQYMIGFGPTLWSRRRGETEYGVKAVPLGGYISMAGMYPAAKQGEADGARATALLDVVMQDEELGDDDARAFYRLPVGKRVIVMLGGPAMNLLLAILMFGIVYCGFGVPTATNVVGGVAECVIAVSEERSECTAEDPFTPANEAGVLPGDRIISLDGVSIEGWDDIPPVVRASAGETILLVVERGDEELELDVTPILTERYALDERGDYLLGPDGEYETVQVGFIGVSPATAIVPQPVTAVLLAVWERSVAMGEVILTFPVRIWDLAVDTFTGAGRDLDSPIGLVGIGRVAGEIASLDDSPAVTRMFGLVELLGGLNLALFLFNLLPLPPLDGGHVVVALWDGIKRAVARILRRPKPRPVDAGKLLPVTLVISAFFVLSSALLLIADIVNPIDLFG